MAEVFFRARCFVAWYVCSSTFHHFSSTSKSVHHFQTRCRLIYASSFTRISCYGHGFACFAQSCHRSEVLKNPQKSLSDCSREQVEVTISVIEVACFVRSCHRTKLLQVWLHSLHLLMT